MYTEQINEDLLLVNQALELMNSDISKDHYNGECSLSRLVGYVSFDTFIPYFYESLELKYILEYLSSFPIRPTQVFVLCDGTLFIDWYANDVQVVSSKSQYIQLIMEFQMFLQNYSSPFFTIEIHESFIGDNVNEKVTGFPIESINFNPRFNTDCFGCNREMEVIYQF